jgi:hypothetical protein
MSPSAVNQAKSARRRRMSRSSSGAVDNERTARATRSIWSRCGVYVVVGVNVNAAHKLNKFPRLDLSVAAPLRNVLADQINSHIWDFLVFRIRES